MSDFSIIAKYFPDLTPKQQAQFAQLHELYTHWNAQINVISRKDMDNLYEKHVLHSLGIAKICSFTDGSEILDVGTGGGFPGIPLAILFPEVSFHLVDSIGKKIKVVQEVADGLGLKNVRAQHERAERADGFYDFVVSRAVTRLQPFMGWIQNKISRNHFNKLDNGVLYLKGGDLKEELAEVNRPKKVYDLSSYFEEEFFETKKVVYVPFK
ncbi:MAG: 16S rRNA (guanine(527)-N(7))-methyltransferase RsmG [Spirosomataceae bacterium]